MNKTYDTLNPHTINIGDEVTPMDLTISPTVIVAGAIASRDFMPVHHDRDFAQAQGAPDIFMNIYTTNGYISRFITDWAGKDTMVRNIRVRLGVPAVPGQVMHFTGAVTAKDLQGDEWLIGLDFKATNDFGDHASGTAEIGLPA